MNQPEKSILTKDVKSWIAYDAGNSAFATTVLAAFFPLFFVATRSKYPLRRVPVFFATGPQND